MTTAKKTTSPAPAQQSIKETNMATKSASEFDFSKLTPTEMIELAAKLQQDAQAGIEKEFEKDINHIVARAKSTGKTLTNYVAALIKLMDAAETSAMYSNLMRTKPGGTATPLKQRAARGSKPAREYVDKDSTGARPEVGKTYVTNGVEWTKGPKGASKKEFIEVVKGGATWASLLKK